VTTIKFVADDENYVEIKLVENEFTQHWLDYFQTKYQILNFRIIKRPTQFPSDWDGFQRPIQNNVGDWLLRIQSGLEFVNRELELKIPDAIRTVNETVDRLNDLPAGQTGYFPIPLEYLNLWHRVFAECMMDLHPRLTKFNLMDRDIKSRKLVDDINNGVHEIEKYCTIKENTRRKKYREYNIFAVEVISSIDENILLAEQIFARDRETIKYHYDHKKDDHWQYNVWLNEDILGKDMIRCWLDHDDMMQHQITGNLMMTPSIQLDPGRLMNRVLDDPDFNSEYTSKNNHKTLDRAPLGNIVSFQFTKDWMAEVNLITIEE
jgi:hypothetical protein